MVEKGDIVCVTPHTVHNDSGQPRQSEFTGHIGYVVDPDPWTSYALVQFGPDLQNLDCWIRTEYLEPLGIRTRVAS